MNVLLIDDDYNLLKVTSLALRGLGHETTAAQSTRQARNALEKRAYDAAVLDLRLGRESGMDLIPDLTTPQAPTPFIILTAYPSVESAVTATKVGAFDYLEKPCMPDDINQKLINIENEITANETKDASLSPQRHIKLGGDFSLEEIEDEHIKRVLKRTKTLSEAVNILKVNRSTLYRKRKIWNFP